jgi:hypothetical protein
MSRATTDASKPLELCSYYDTSRWPDFKPVCKLGKSAGLWCHKAAGWHSCGKYEVLENR